MKARTANRVKAPAKAKSRAKAKTKALRPTQLIYRLRRHLKTITAHCERLVEKVHTLENEKLTLWHRLRVLETGPQSVTQR